VAVRFARPAFREKKEIVKEASLNTSSTRRWPGYGSQRLSKRLPSFTAPMSLWRAFTSTSANNGDQVLRYYRFTNSTPSKLGNEPLPDGAVKAFRFITDDNLYAFVGSTAVNTFRSTNKSTSNLVMIWKCASNNFDELEKIDLQFDNRGNVKDGHERTWQIEMQNSKDIMLSWISAPVQRRLVPLRRNRSSKSWMQPKSSFFSVSSRRQSKTISYTLTTRTERTRQDSPSSAGLRTAG